MNEKGLGISTTALPRDQGRQCVQSWMLWQVFNFQWLSIWLSSYMSLNIDLMIKLHIHLPLGNCIKHDRPTTWVLIKRAALSVPCLCMSLFSYISAVIFGGSSKKISIFCYIIICMNAEILQILKCTSHVFGKKTWSLVSTFLCEKLNLRQICMPWENTP